MKLMVERVQHSAQGNIQDIQQQVHSIERSKTDHIDQAFLSASRDPGQINAPAEMLKREGLWTKYEDCFFALAKASGN